MRKGDFYDTYQISNENHAAAEIDDLLVVSISVDPWDAVLFYVWRDRRSGAVSESAGGGSERDALPEEFVTMLKEVKTEDEIPLFQVKTYDDLTGAEKALQSEKIYGIIIFLCKTVFRSDGETGCRQY